MKALAEVEAVDVAGVVAKKASGRYSYKSWHQDAGGNRIAVTDFPSAAHIPDLISTAYANAKGRPPTVYGLAFDFDAHRAAQRWYDHEGKLDWGQMSAFLLQEYPEIGVRITHVVRSSGRKGLGIVVGINPLPINSETERNQKAAQALQSRLIMLFNELGFGADPAARGLVRDFPNFKNKDRCLYLAPEVQRQMETGKEAVITLLHRYLNELDARRRKERRLYPDLRGERGLSRLVGFLLGMCASETVGSKAPGYMTGDEAFVTTKQLQTITNLSDKFLRRFFKVPPQWLRVRYIPGEGWGLCVVFGRALERLMPRIEEMLSRRECSGQPKVMFSLSRLELPEAVEDGARNIWLVSVSLAYKWAGVAKGDAYARLSELIKRIPGFSSSRNCHQVRSILKSIYRRVPETFGMWSSKELPEWMGSIMLPEACRLNVAQGTSHRRGVAPGGVVWAADGEPSSPVGMRRSNFSVQILSIAADESVAAPPSDGADVSAPCIGPLLLLPQSSAFSQDQAVPSSELRLVAIRRGHRVGIFDGEKLILCVTKRHYRASWMVKWLYDHQKYSKDLSLKVHTPHMKQQAKYYPAIDQAEFVMKSEALGLKRTFSDKLQEWSEKNGMKTELCTADIDCGEIPF